jgi:hypothetical protein
MMQQLISLLLVVLSHTEPIQQYFKLNNTLLGLVKYMLVLAAVNPVSEAITGIELLSTSIWENPPSALKSLSCALFRVHSKCLFALHFYRAHAE